MYVENSSSKLFSQWQMKAGEGYPESFVWQLGWQKPQGFSFRTKSNWRHVVRGDAHIQVCRYSTICLRGWLAEQHLRTVSSSCFPTSPDRLIHTKTILHSMLAFLDPSFFILSSPFLHFSLSLIHVRYAFVWLILIRAGFNRCSHDEICSTYCLLSKLFLFFLFTWLSVSLSSFSSHLFTMYPFVLWRTEEEKKHLASSISLKSKNNKTITGKKPCKLALLLHMVWRWRNPVSDISFFLKGNQCWTAVILTYLMKVR